MSENNEGTSNVSVHVDVMPLAIVLILLKVTGTVEMPWWVALAPVWIPVAIPLSIIGGVFLLAALTGALALAIAIPSHLYGAWKMAKQRRAWKKEQEEREARQLEESRAIRLKCLRADQEREALRAHEEMKSRAQYITPLDEQESHDKLI